MKSLVERAREWEGEEALRGELAASRWGSDPALEDVRGRWLMTLKACWPAVPAKMIERAVGEALALASCTVAPLLVFPALAEEKVAEVVAWNERQRRILDRSCTLLAE